MLNVKMELDGSKEEMFQDLVGDLEMPNSNEITSLGEVTTLTKGNTRNVPDSQFGRIGG